MPPGSEIRFRRPGIWSTYRGQMIAIFSALPASGGDDHLVARRAPPPPATPRLELRRRLLEVIHLNRTAAAAALSASFAHELNQPLAAILSNAQTAEALLSANPPDLHQLEGDSRRHSPQTTSAPPKSSTTSAAC